MNKTTGVPEWDREAADDETARLNELGRRSSELRKQGKCSHGWWKTYPDGTAQCLHCLKMFGSTDDLIVESHKLLSGEDE